MQVDYFNPIMLLILASMQKKKKKKRQRSVSMMTPTEPNRRFLKTMVPCNGGF